MPKGKAIRRREDKSEHLCGFSLLERPERFGGLETDEELASLLDKSFDLLGCWVNLSEKKKKDHPKHFVDHEATSWIHCTVSLREGLWREAWIDGVALKRGTVSVADVWQKLVKSLTAASVDKTWGSWVKQQKSLAPKFEILNTNDATAIRRRSSRQQNLSCSLGGRDGISVSSLSVRLRQANCEHLYVENGRHLFCLSVFSCAVAQHEQQFEISEKLWKS